MQEVQEKLRLLGKEIKKAQKFLDIPNKKGEIEKLEKQASVPNFWNDQAKARQVSQELADLQASVGTWEILGKDLTDLYEMTKVIHLGGDAEDYADLVKNADELEKRFNQANVQLLLSDEYDRHNALVSFHAGTGGTDAQDWAEMLMRMYLRYAERRGYKTKILDQSAGEEAGIKSATVLIEGSYAYGYLKNENGVHRLVRLSPFNSGNTRETSFALVEILPDLPADAQLDLKDEDLKIETFRARGHGGQSVNTTDSAVRITHAPTGLKAQCQNERSQQQNREQALKVLKARLIHLKEEQKAETLDELRGQNTDLTWGHQIRSYVLHPYTMVKDHRFKYETPKAEEILDGDLDELIEAGLTQKK